MGLTRQGRTDTLTLTIKKKWYDMILSGEKKAEYRDIKPFYISRFRNHFYTYEKGEDTQDSPPTNEGFLQAARKLNIWFDAIILKNGYRKDSRAMKISGVMHVETGKPEWGAEPGKEYFVLHIGQKEEICPGRQGTVKK